MSNPPWRTLASKLLHPTYRIPAPFRSWLECVIQLPQRYTVPAFERLYADSETKIIYGSFDDHSVPKMVMRENGDPYTLAMLKFDLAEFLMRNACSSGEDKLLNDFIRLTWMDGFTKDLNDGKLS